MKVSKLLAFFLLVSVVSAAPLLTLMGGKPKLASIRKQIDADVVVVAVPSGDAKLLGLVHAVLLANADKTLSLSFIGVEQAEHEAYVKELVAAYDSMTGACDGASSVIMKAVNSELLDYFYEWRVTCVVRDVLKGQVATNEALDISLFTNAKTVGGTRPTDLAQGAPYLMFVDRDFLGRRRLRGSPYLLSDTQTVHTIVVVSDNGTSNIDELRSGQILQAVRRALGENLQGLSVHP